MSISSPEELAGMEQAGKVTRAVLEAMKAAARAGISTRELDELGAAVMRSRGGRSGPKKVYGFPGHSCISVNDEVVHGIPGARKLADGDLVKLDVTIEVSGYMGDACETVAVGDVGQDHRKLIECAKDAFQAGLSAVHPGARAFDIGNEIQKTVHAAGFFVVRDLGGHGIGHTIHEEPLIPNDYDRRCSDVITEGLVFTIEPIIAMGTSRTITLKDGWTIRTRDHSFAAHYEHTVIVTANGTRLLTA
ncbi:MAG TPA: type I methionyl aminopeptidase [Candidatus Saccharimonadales bacterium]|nr:type I methionyl aminopeptidase [Candidatus Saccharimonadales bacterium]